MTHHAPQETAQIHTNGLGNGDHPSLSLVVPCYNVATYLPVLLRSLDAQDCEHGAVELIFVNDGSPDDSERIVAEWMRSTDFPVVLAVQPNRGVSGALNQGTDLARADWVSYSGPDDELSSNYFSEILAAIAASPEIDMHVTRMVRLRSDGELTHHPLDFRFAKLESNSVVDLLETPEKIHLHAGMAAFRVSRIRKYALSFDERLRQGFEDAHFIARYLLTLETPRYQLLPNAHYRYRAREGSLTSVLNFTKYINVIEVAYFDLLDRVNNDCPAWLGSLILYDMWWLFVQYTQIRSTVFSISDTQQHQLHDLTREALRRVGLRNVQTFRVINVPVDIRTAWEYAASPEGVTHVAILREHDEVRGLQKIVFHSADAKATAEVFDDGKPVQVGFAKTRAVLFFDQIWIYEHILWIRTSGIAHRLENLNVRGTSPGLTFAFGEKALTARKAGRLLKKVPPSLPKPGTQSMTLRDEHAHRAALQIEKTKRDSRNQRRRLALAYRVGGYIGLRKKFADAWVLIDRNTQANDNAEALYRFIASERPDINAWFVIDRSSPDFARLRADGFRLVAHGSWRHFCLMKEARVLTSSMIDQYIVRPFPKEFLPKTWTYSFLQHGVTQVRLHRWWNIKNIDHLVTSTLAEHQSIVADGSPYDLSDREVTLTGMPRHDRLFRLSQERTGSGAPRRVVIMPTWRNYLAGLTEGAENALTAGFYESDFVQNWLRFLHSDTVVALSQRTDVDVVLLPHPGIDKHWTDLQLPDGMRRLSYLGDDVQELLAGADVVVTDYSSQAFEGAFCGAPTLYFQFDRDTFFAGNHIGSPGYFDYERDGFGPVRETLDSAVTALQQLVDDSLPELPDYRDRIERLYAFHDSGASARVVAAIEERLQPITATEGRSAHALSH
ncbi:bifunctional glycosyltransferase/CDP-glycerol:glycerophosphate glycerophosphotransferase [Leucobacter musarum]|uniref:bifunctional glycosyltransferase/CDP-glycerol:glycerophosphate glycerophosphotransferase n=1 Tax=Leucobacter musarum TaxID=1930747 RepID=UPI000949AC5F|nr:CDP-glycerol glycerophosphotransferase family protein [Leucobacter musarum]